MAETDKSNNGVCPFSLAEEENGHQISRCKVKPDVLKDSGYMPCVSQNTCPIWKEICAAEERGFKNGKIWQKIEMTTH